MAGEQIAQVGVETENAQARREWVKPRILDMLAGAAELGGSNNVDGDPGLS